jgi:hypothetical protein
MEHLKKYHPEYYKWTKRWTNSLYLPLIPFVVLLALSAPGKDVSLLLIAISVLAIPYLLLLLYRWVKVSDFRETWSQAGKA